MSRKAYSKEERENIRIALLSTGLRLYSKQGINKVNLQDILDEVGISKPFFYKYFPSVQEFVVQIIEFQWLHLEKKVEMIQKQHAFSWEERMRSLLTMLIHHRDHGILIMTQEEEVWARKRVSDTRYQEFMNYQVHFFRLILAAWDVPNKDCNPKVLANLILSMCVTYNSAQNNLPFFYLDSLEEGAKAQAEGIILYLNKK